MNLQLTCTVGFALRSWQNKDVGVLCLIAQAFAGDLGQGYAVLRWWMSALLASPSGWFHVLTQSGHGRQETGFSFVLRSSFYMSSINICPLFSS